MTAPRLRRLGTADLTAGEVGAIRALLDEAFGENDDDRFGEDDWQHALGGTHFVLDVEGEILAHAAVVERELHAGDHRLTSAYVEAVATRRDLQGRGLGSAVMREVGEYTDHTFPLGALDTGVQAFYERLGWVTWTGPTFVRTESGLVRTAEDDGNVMVRLTPTSPELDLSAPISCEWHPGDVW